MHMSKRIRTTLTLDDEIVNRAKELGINISAAAERGIIEYIKEIEYIRSKRKKSHSNDNSSKEQIPKIKNHRDDSVGLLRFERKSMAPEATRIPSYPTGPNGVAHQKEKTNKRVFGEKDRLKLFEEST